MESLEEFRRVNTAKQERERRGETGEGGGGVIQFNSIQLLRI